MKHPDDDVPFRTRWEDARLDAPVVRLPSGKMVTALPLADGIAPTLPDGTFLRASLVRVDAIKALDAFGLKLCSLATLHEMASVGIWIPPQTLVSDVYDQQHMQSLGYKREHDARCWSELAKRGVTAASLGDLALPVFNFGKTHKAAEEAGRPVPENGDNFLGGWDKVDDGRANFIQAGVGRNHRGEAKSLHDYGTNTYGEAA